MIRNGKILAVDDEDAVLEIYRDLLEPFGWKVEYARSYVEAVDKLDEGDWSVVLVDQKLRGSGSPTEGLGLIDEIEKRSPGAKAIMVTGYASPDAIDHAFRAGAYDYIEKTESFETLLRVKVEQAMEIQRQRQLASASDDEAKELWERLQTETNSHTKGRLLEDLMELLLRSVPGFVVASRRRGVDEEFDLVVRNESADPFWSHEGQYFIVECKNWSRPTDPRELDRLLQKLDRRFGRARLGFLVAVGGFTAGVGSTLSAERKSDRLVVPLDKADLQRLIESTDRSAALKAMHQATVEDPAG